MKRQLIQFTVILSCLFSFQALYAQQTINTAGSYKSYNNYDFTAGEKIIFEDDFRSDQDGEFPAHWDLQSGQAVVNKVVDVPSLSMVEGNYAKVFPRVKIKQYLPEAFTVELDHLMQSVNKPSGIVLFFVNAAGKEAMLTINDNTVNYNFQSKNISSQLPDDIRTKKYLDKWNHIALACRNNQMKVYVNQFRVLVLPGLDFVPVSLKIGGIGSQKSPILCTNVKIAEGGGMNLLQKLTTDGHLIIHGIRFDYNKSTIKPESMGVINQIVTMMKDNMATKYEIQGHTDSDGNDDFNIKLSEQRADAVRDILVELGIEKSRLTTRGFGKSKPISDNDSPEGKANNRRVEFVKL